MTIQGKKQTNKQKNQKQTKKTTQNKQTKNPDYHCK